MATPKCLSFPKPRSSLVWRSSVSHTLDRAFPSTIAVTFGKPWKPFIKLEFTKNTQRTEMKKLIIAFLLLTLFSGAGLAQDEKKSAKKKQFIYVLKLIPRLLKE